MKKYKVLTKNIRWFGIQEGAEITFTDDLKIHIQNILEGGLHPNFWTASPDEEFKIKILIEEHKDWFEEVKEGRKNLLDCLLQDSIDKGLKLDEINKSLEDIINSLKKDKKQIFSKQDMIEFAKYFMNHDGFHDTIFSEWLRIKDK